MHRQQYATVLLTLIFDTFWESIGHSREEVVAGTALVLRWLSGEKADNIDGFYIVFRGTYIFLRIVFSGYGFWRLVVLKEDDAQDAPGPDESTGPGSRKRTRWWADCMDS
ncbi:uncharacterized protein LTR77_006721 [Saxophila tyrrhenica]|uniref:Uncharacterized protein n=1 Tax=Saxophila tyrrhenica TaxID=1690608 RepID=A0AAV9P640_9PEZI|nr:hypothetical protein LTR77_006721 [Saxophila tyrrhenica]